MAFWTCGCGAVNISRAGQCEVCGEGRQGGQQEREAPTPANGPNVCARCSSRSPSTTEFHDDGAPEDRGVRLCPACWVPALRRRAELDAVSAQARAGYMAEIRRAAAVMTARVRTVDAVALPDAEGGGHP